MYNLDTMAMIVFTETAMGETPEYFDEADRLQFKIMKEAGLLYLDEKNKKETVNAVSSIISVNKQKLLLRINIIATDMYNHLKKEKHFNRITSYFGTETGSSITRTEEKSFNFIISCYPKVKKLGEKSNVQEFETKLKAIYDDVIKVTDSLEDNQLTKLSNSSERDVLEEAWYKEFRILSSMFDIKAIKFGFDKKKYIKRIPLRKTVKTNDKNNPAKNDSNSTNVSNNASDTSVASENTDISKDIIE